MNLLAAWPFCLKWEVTVLHFDGDNSFLGTESNKTFVDSWSAYIDPTAIFTLGHGHNKRDG